MSYEKYEALRARLNKIHVNELDLIVGTVSKQRCINTFNDCKGDLVKIKTVLIGAICGYVESGSVHEGLIDYVEKNGRVS